MTAATNQLPRRSGAFTLVEVMVVLVIIGIAAAIVVPKMLQAGTLSLEAATRMVVADLLEAQNQAVAMQSPRKVVFDLTDNRYRLCDAQGNAVATLFGDGSTSFQEDRRFQDVRLEKVDFAGGQQVQFDVLGSPDSPGTIDLAGSQKKFRITLAAMTGRIHVQPLN